MTQKWFQETVFVLKDEMYRFAKSYLLSMEEAQDVVQELMLKFWQKKETLNTYENLKSYVLTCVRNECLNRLKHEKVKKAYAGLMISNAEYYRPEVNNLRDQIIEYINELPEKQRLVIHMKDVEEYSVAEISEVLEMEQNAVRVNLMRAREKIKTQITQLMNYEKRQLS